MSANSNCNLDGRSVPVDPAQDGVDQGRRKMQSWLLGLLGVAAAGAASQAKAATWVKVNGTADNALRWGGGSKTISTAAPSGGVDGDVWFQYV